MSLLVLLSCTDELSVSNEFNDIREEGNVKVQFSINAPEQGIAETRTLDDLNDDTNKQEDLNLWLFVFDSNGLFLYAAEATPDDNSVTHDSHKDTNFTATLNATSDQRIIHFVAFDDAETGGLSSQIQATINKFGTDVEKIYRELYTTAGQAAYWQRIVVNGIKKVGGDSGSESESIPAGEFVGYNTCVPLVRNFAKITVAPKDGIQNFTFEGFTIVNAPNKGTIAPYKGGFIEFVNEDKTQKTYETLSGNPIYYEGTSPEETGYSTIANDDHQEDITSAAHYLYETPNASGDAKGRTTLIVKGKYGSGDNIPSTYYKVDMIYDPEDETAGHMFYNILRNFWYKVTITEVTGNGHTTFAEAVASAASNNLSASTVTASLSRISDGEQMIEVSDTYFLFTKENVQQVVKYRYRYSADGGENWTINNDLISLKTTGDMSMYSAEPTIVTTSDDSDGWRTITMTLAETPTDNTKTTNLHIYASRAKISDENLHLKGDTNDELKKSILSGELLYRDVRVDFRTLYPLQVVPQSYVKAKMGTQFRVDLLIPASVNEALFPMDFLLEDSQKYIYPDGSVATKMPVNVDKSIVPEKDENSFQYVRTVTKAEFATLQTKSVGGVSYYIIPCYFRTNVATSATTTIYASNQYFTVGSGQFSHNPLAFRENSELTYTAGENTFSNNQKFKTTELYGRGYPITYSFYVTEEAIGKNFTITITEQGATEPTTHTLTAEAKETNLETFTDGNGVQYKYYRQDYIYNTKTLNGNKIDATVTTTMNSETKTSSLTMQRRYFVIAKNSFKTDIASHLTGGAVADGAQIYVTDNYKPEFNGGTYVGWFGRGLSQAADGALGNDGPKADYVIDRYYQGYTTLTDGMDVTFRIYNTNIKATTTIEFLDNARITPSTMVLSFGN